MPLARAAVLALFLATGCGGAPAPESARATARSTPAPASEGESASVAEGLSEATLCAAVQAAVLEAEARDRRARAEARAEDYGMTAEEVLAEWDEDEEAEEEPPTWSCPAQDQGNYQRQPAFAPRALAGGGSARIVPIDRTHFSGELERFAYLAVQPAGQPLHLEPLGSASDPGHGQDWGQLVVTSFGGEGSRVEVTAEGLDCVPAGFTEEDEGEPPSCYPTTRRRVTCTLEGAVRCERVDEDVEAP